MASAISSLERRWLRFLQTAHLCDATYSFQKLFTHLPSHQIISLQSKFEDAPGKSLSCSEFVAALASSREIFESIDEYGHTSLKTLARILNAYIELYNDESKRDHNRFLAKIRALIIIFNYLDVTHANRLSWSDFSEFLSTFTTPTLAISDTHVSTIYNTSIHSKYLLSTKILEPIYSVTYSSDADVFLACCRDNNVHVLDSKTFVHQAVLQGHHALPVAATSFKPAIEGFSHAHNDIQSSPGRRVIGGFNYITSGTDRKLIIWNGITHVPISILPTENIHTALATIDELHYQKTMLSPAIFSGDDHGNVYFWKLTEQHIAQPLSPVRAYTKFNVDNSYTMSVAHNIIGQQKNTAGFKALQPGTASVSIGDGAGVKLAKSSTSRAGSVHATHAHDEEDDMHGVVAQFYASMTNAKRKFKSATLKEDVENLVLFYDMKNFSGHVPFAEGYNLSFFLEDSDDWKKVSGDYKPDTYKYDDTLMQLFSETYESTDLTAPAPEFTALAKKMVMAFQTNSDFSTILDQKNSTQPSGSAPPKGTCSKRARDNGNNNNSGSNRHLTREREPLSADDDSDRGSRSESSDMCGETDTKQAQRNRSLIRKHMTINRRRQQYIQNSFRSMTMQELAPTPIWTIKGHKDWVTCLCLDTVLSSNATILASGGTDGLINVYDINRGVINANLHFHKGSVTGLTWLHHRGLLAACSQDHQITLWSLGTSNTKPVSVISTSDAPYAAIFSHKLKNEIVTVDTMGNLAIYDVRRMEPIQSISNNVTKTGRIVSAGYNEYTGLVATVGRAINYFIPINEDNTQRCSLSAINVWCSSSTAPLMMFVSDGSLQFWDMLYGKLLRSINHIFSPSFYFRSRETEKATRDILGLPAVDFEDPQSGNRKGSVDASAQSGFLPPIHRDDTGRGKAKTYHKPNFSYNENYNKLKKTKEGALGHIDSWLNNSDEAQMYQKNISNLFNTDLSGAINLKQLSLDNIRELHSQEQQYIKQLEKNDCGTVTFGLECTAIALSPDTNVYSIAMTDGRVTVYERATDKILMEVRYTNAHYDQKREQMEHYSNTLGIPLDSLESTSTTFGKPGQTEPGTGPAMERSSRHAKVRHLVAATRDHMQKYPDGGPAATDLKGYDDEPCTSLFISEYLTPLCAHHHGTSTLETGTKRVVNDARVPIKSNDDNQPAQQAIVSATLANQDVSFMPLIVWLFFKQSARIYTYRLAKDQPYLVGRLRLRSPWTDIAFCQDLNVVHIYFNTEVYTLSADSVMLSKAEIILKDNEPRNTKAPQMSESELKLEMRLILTPGESFQLWIFSCGLVLVIHIKTSFLLAVLLLPSVSYIAHAACIEELNSFVVLDQIGQLYFYDISEIASIVSKFEATYLLTLPRGPSCANFASNVHFVSSFEVQKVSDGIYVPSNREAITEASEAVKKSAPISEDAHVGLCDGSPLQIRVVTNFLTKRHFFTVFDVAEKDRSIFADVVSEKVWQLIDLFSKNRGTQQVGTSIKAHTLSREEKAWYSGKPVVICPRQMSMIATVPFLIDLGSEDTDANVGSNSKVMTPLPSFGIVSIQPNRVIGIYLCMCTTGYILAFDARKACFLCTLVHRGWPQKIKKYLRYNLNTATPNRSQRLLLNRFMAEEEKSIYLQAYVSDQVKEELKSIELSRINASVTSSSVVGGLASVTLKTPKGSKLNQTQSAFPVPSLATTMHLAEESSHNNDDDALDTARTSCSTSTVAHLSLAPVSASASASATGTSKRGLTIATRNKDGSLLTSTPAAFTPTSFGKMVGVGTKLHDVRLLPKMDPPLQSRDLGVGRFLIQCCITDIKNTAFRRVGDSDRPVAMRSFNLSSRVRSTMSYFNGTSAALKEQYKSRTASSPMRVPLFSVGSRGQSRGSNTGTDQRESRKSRDREGEKTIDLTKSMLDVPPIAVEGEELAQEQNQQQERNAILGRSIRHIRTSDADTTRLDLSSIISRRESSIFNRMESPVRRPRPDAMKVAQSAVEEALGAEEKHGGDGQSLTSMSALTEMCDILNMQRQDIALRYKKVSSALRGGYIDYEAIKK